MTGHRGEVNGNSSSKDLIWHAIRQIESIQQDIKDFKKEINDELVVIRKEINKGLGKKTPNKIFYAFVSAMVTALGFIVINFILK